MLQQFGTRASTSTIGSEIAGANNHQSAEYERLQNVLAALQQPEAINLGDQLLNRVGQLSPLPPRHALRRDDSEAIAPVPLQPTPRNHPTAGLPTHLQSMVRTNMILEEELNLQRSHCVPGPGDYSAPYQHSNPGPIHLADSAWVRLHSRYSRLSVHR